MLYFLFFFIHFIIADENIDKKDESNIPQQTDVNIQEKKLSLDEHKPDPQETTNPSGSIPPPNKTKINISHPPHRKLKRMNATNNIPRYSPDNESTTIGLDQPESSTSQTQKVNKLRRRNAKFNIPKIELDDEKKTEDKENENKNQPNPDFSNEEAFNEDKSDPFDEEHDDDKTNSEDSNSQTETQQNEPKETKTEINERLQPEKTNTTIPNQTETPPTPTTPPLPIQTPTKTNLPTQTEQPPTPTKTSLPIQTENPPTPTQTPTATPYPTQTENPTPTATTRPIQKHDQEIDINSQNKKADFSNNEVKQNVKKKLPKFHIVSVSPQTVRTHGDEKIEITMNATLDGPPFIRFGESKIVHGRHSKKDLTVKCRTPKLQEGEIEISVSIDKIKWCEPFPLIVVADEADLPWIFVCCAGVAIIAVSLMVSKLVCGKRAVPKKKKPSKYRDDDLMNIMAPNYSSNDLRKRTKIPTEV